MQLGPLVLGSLALALASLASLPHHAAAADICTPDDIEAGLCVPEPPVVDPPPGEPPAPPPEPGAGGTPPDPDDPPDTPPDGAGEGDPPTPELPVIDLRAARGQMYRNGLRGLAYVSTWGEDGLSEPSTIAVQPVQTVALDGDGTENAWGNVYPIDLAGDGQYGFVHFNGLRVIRVFDAQGQKLWEERNPTGRTHRSSVHRDTMAVLDSNGDGHQDIVHCWGSPTDNSRMIVIRDGATGTILHSVAIADGTSDKECQIAAFPIQNSDKPIILVSRRAARGTVCDSPYIDTWSRTTAFDLELNQLWDQQTCAAGHYAWPLDEDADGRAEAIFVGKYLLEPDGTPRCMLPDWGNNHVDSMVVTDLDPATPGYEAVAVGKSGVRFYQAASCDLRWSIHGSVISHPQLVSAVRTTTWPDAPAVLVSPKSRRTDPHLYRLSPTGVVLEREGFAQLTQNANIDGARMSEDLVGPYGQVIGLDGSYRLTASWYWNLQTLTRAERALPAADQWAWQPVIFDLDHDGRDEIIVWGRKLLVVGKAL